MASQVARVLLTARPKGILFDDVLASLALAAVTSIAPVTARAGEIARVVAPMDVAHARAAAGRVLGWDGTAIHWRAPPVCSPAVVTLVAQFAGGSEEPISVEVIPGGQTGALAIVPAAAAENIYELQSASDETLSFAASPGEVEPLAPLGACQRASWRLSHPRWPDFAAAAAFSGTRLVAWSSLSRSAPNALPVKAPPGQKVRATVDGRAFFGVGGAGGMARVAIEVPPGVLQAEAIELDLVGKESPKVAALNPPPPRTDHVIARPDGSVWLFRMDSRGAPADGELPMGAERIAQGAFLLQHSSEGSDPARIAVESAAPENERSAQSPTDARRMDSAARAPEVPRRVARWRSGAAVAFSPTGQPAAALTHARILPLTRRFDLGFGGALLFATRRYTALEIEDTGRRWVGALGAWTEIALPMSWGPFEWAPALGIGGAVAWRRVTLPLRPTDRLEAGPLGTASLRLGTNRIALSLRLLISTAHVGSEPTDTVGMAGATFGW